MHGGAKPVLWDQGAVDFVVGFTSISNEFILHGDGVPGSAILTNLNTTTTSVGRGAGSTRNRLVITNGGALFNAGIFTLGYTADRNDLIVSGEAPYSMEGMPPSISPMQDRAICCA